MFFIISVYENWFFSFNSTIIFLQTHLSCVLFIVDAPAIRLFAMFSNNLSIKEFAICVLKGIFNVGFQTRGLFLQHKFFIGECGRF